MTVITRNLVTPTIKQSELDTIKLVRKDKTIVVLPADKGQMTVVIDQADNNDKATALLNDTSIYQELSNNLTKQLVTKINSKIKSLHDASELADAEKWKMRISDTNIAQFYGLIMIDKKGTPLQPIVSLTGSPTCNLSNYL